MPGTVLRLGLPQWLSGEESTCNAENTDVGSFLGWEDPLEDGMATHPRILAWRIPWIEESGALQSIGLQGRTWLKRLSTHTCAKARDSMALSFWNLHSSEEEWVWINKCIKQSQLCVCVCVCVTWSCLTLRDPMNCNSPGPRLLCPWNSPGKNTGNGCHFLLQWIFLTQGLNPGLLHCRQTLYHLRQQGCPITIVVEAKEGNKQREKFSLMARKTSPKRWHFSCELKTEKDPTLREA